MTDGQLAKKEGMPPLKYSAEAQAQLADSGLDATQTEILEAFLRLRLWQEAFWSSDASAGDAEVTRKAQRMEVSADLLRGTIEDILNPEALQKHLFLNNLVASEGNLTQCMRAYELRDQWETSDSPMSFSEQDCQPYKIQMVRVFDGILKAVKKAQDPNAQDMLQRLIEDFGEVPGVQLVAWLKKRILQSLSPMKMLEWRDVLEKNPGRFEELLRDFLGGSSGALTSSAEALTA